MCLQLSTPESTRVSTVLARKSTAETGRSIRILQNRVMIKEKYEEPAPRESLSKVTFERGRSDDARMRVVRSQGTLAHHIVFLSSRRLRGN